MKIHYVKEGNGLYYDEIYTAFAKNSNFELSPYSQDVEYLFLGPAFLSDGGLVRNEKALLATHAKKVLFLNKEYKNLKRKFDFINRNRIETVLTVHHDFEKWNKECPNSKFYKIPFAYNENIFFDYGEEKQFDIGFTGNLFNAGDYKATNMMGPNFNNVRERIFDVLKNSNDLNKYVRALGPGVYLKGEEYGRTINKTKAWISTPSAIDLVGTRFYEVMGSNTLLFCKMLPDIYNGLFEEGVHFVGFKDDLSDFEEKLCYYLENDEERNKIARQGYEHVRKNHTWTHRVNSIYDILLAE